jgi:predicted nucleotidyltransferase
MRWSDTKPSRYSSVVLPIETQRAIEQRLAAEPAIVAAWIFGSTARGTERPDSDVDIAILTSRPAEHTMADLWLDLRADLTQLAGTEVDLDVVDDAPADLTHRVMRDGVILIDRDRAARIRFEVAARNRFFDMTPIWDEYRRARPRAAR